MGFIKTDKPYPSFQKSARSFDIHDGTSSIALSTLIMSMEGSSWQRFLFSQPHLNAYRLVEGWGHAIRSLKNSQKYKQASHISLLVLIFRFFRTTNQMSCSPFGPPSASQIILKKASFTMMSVCSMFRNNKLLIFLPGNPFAMLQNLVLQRRWHLNLLNENFIDRC